MSLLDELKLQADALRQRQQSGQETYEDNVKRIHARLKEAHGKLYELVNSLNVVKPEVTRYYYLEGNKVLDGLRQGEYALSARRKSIDHTDYFEEIILRTQCRRDGFLTVEKDSEALVERMKQFLWSNNLKFDLKETRSERGYTERGVFAVLQEVPIHITIAGLPQKGQVVIMTKNLEKLGEIVYTYDIDEIDATLVEELARLLLNKPNQFRSLGRHQQAVLAHAPAPARSAAQPEALGEADDYLGGDELLEPAPAPEPERRKGLMSSLRSLIRRKSD